MNFRYAITPTEVLLRSDIPWKMKGRYSILLGRALNKPFVDLLREEIAELWSQAEGESITPRGVSAYLAKMEEAGLVHRERRRRCLRLHLQVRHASKSEPDLHAECNSKADLHATCKSEVQVTSINDYCDDDDFNSDLDSDHHQTNNYYSAEVFEKLAGVPDFWADKARLLAADPWVTQDRIERWVAKLEADPQIDKLPAVLFLNLSRHREPPMLEENDEAEGGAVEEVIDPLEHMYQFAQSGGDEALAAPTVPSPEYSKLVKIHAEALGIPPPQGREGRAWAKEYQEIVKAIADTYSLSEPNVAFTLTKQALQDLAKNRGTRDGNFWWRVWSSPRAASLRGKLIEEAGRVISKKARQTPSVTRPTRPEEPLIGEEKIWQQALDELKLQMTRATFDTWLKDTHALPQRDGTFVVGVRTAYAKDWLENRLGKSIERVLNGLLEEPVEIQFEVAQSAEALP